MIARSVLEMIHSCSPASFASRSAGIVSGKTLELFYEMGIRQMTNVEEQLKRTGTAVLVSEA